jgi:iron complex outermembrane recepter protein
MSINTKAALLAATVLGAATAAPVWAQTSDDAGTGANDIIVTAQRIEQRLQDVPISITVVNQAKLDNNNITNLKDVAQLTPGFAVNNRYGADNTTFTIRGFYQEQRSFATVGVFFNDVVAPRGSGATFGGDGAGPGAMFDLQNVQVLKGPQGTLFGRNVTGGAVLLVPNKPSDKLEGYIEGGAGNYDMWRLQGVVNIPISDSFKIRAGVDHMDRLGYLKNAGNLGDGKFDGRGLGDTNYWAGRLSATLDVSPDIENYTVATYTHSKSNGVIPKVTAAFPGTSNLAYFGNESAAQIAREEPLGFWSVSNRLPDSQSIAETWQVINTLTWTASDSLTVKNILSYGEMRGKTNLDLFGGYSLLPGVTFGSETPGQVRGFAFTANNALAGRTNSQRSMVGELQFQGRPGDGTFTWQAGGYVEINDPIGFSGVQTASFTACDDIATYDCLPGAARGGSPLSGGTGSFQLNKTKFRDYALYAQGSYKLTEQLTFTAGIRYTWDKMRSELINSTSVFAANPSDVGFGCTNPQAPGFTTFPAQNNPASFPFTLEQSLTACRENLQQDTSAPTWLVQADYKPIDDVMLYGKWSRGYRQGGLAIFGPGGLQAYDKETVDTFEVGAKTSWRGALPGSFNIAGYYNDFRDQQLQLGVSCVPPTNPPPADFVPCPGNATILNAGKSTIWGFEADATISPFQGLTLNVAYAYINAKLKELIIPAFPSDLPYNNVSRPNVTGSCTGEQCDVIPNSGPPHQVVASANYTLPFDESAGRFTVGGTFIYQSRRRIVADGVPGSGLGVAPSSSVLNLNATWANVGQMPLDLSFFMTNVTNEKVILQINDNFLRGFVSSTIGEPRMWGFRARVKFGQ